MPEHWIFAYGSLMWDPCGYVDDAVVEQILDHVISPLYHHVAFALEVDDAYARRLVSDVLAMSR